MERIFQYTISSEYENKPIDFYLKSMGFSSKNIIELKKMPESILLNDVWVYTRTTLHEGDTLTIHLLESAVSDKIKPVSLPFPIVYEDEDILVVNKPGTMPVHPSRMHINDTLANAVL